jgi:hypothetical protein
MAGPSLPLYPAAPVGNGEPLVVTGLRPSDSVGQGCNTVNRLDVATLKHWLPKLAAGAVAGERG